MKKFFKEFAKFINRGNAIDLAIGVVLGASFTAIINSLVNGIFYPLLDLIPGSNNVSLFKIVLKKESEGNPPVILDLSSFISALLSFLLTAFVLFLLLKLINKIREEKKDESTSIRENSEK